MPRSASNGFVQQNILNDECHILNIDGLLGVSLLYYLIASIEIFTKADFSSDSGQPRLR